MLIACLVVAAAVGASCRFLVDGWIGPSPKSTFAMATFTVNATGSFVAGLITGAVLYHALPTDVRVVTATGFCGAFTTFGTWMFELVGSLDDRAPVAAVANLVVSVLTGAAAAGLGLLIAAL